MSASRQPVLFGALAVVAIVGAPFVFTPVMIPRLTEVLAFVVAFAGLHVLSGRLGLISIGHAGFVGIGAVGAALAINELALPYLTAPIVGALTAGLLGAVIAIPSLKLPGTYLALLTLSVAMAVPIAIRRVGTLGVVIDGNFTSPPWLGLAENRIEYWQYGVVALIAVVTMVVTALALQGQMGRSLLAVKDEPTAAAAFGIHVARTQVIGVTGASALAGVAGGLLVLNTPFVSGETYPLDRSLAMFALMIALGSRSLAASVPAAIVLVMLPEFLVEIGWSSWEPIIYGLLLLVMTRVSGPRELLTSLIGDRRQTERRRDEVAPEPDGDELEFVEL